MKTPVYIIMLLLATTFMAACSGDHSTRNGQDTAREQYKVQGSGVDTAKTTTTTGDASNVDDSGSGGTETAKHSREIQKDTANK